MKNIVIYTDKKSSALAEVLSSIEDANIRLENAENLRNYEALNPGVIIIENVQPSEPLRLIMLKLLLITRNWLFVLKIC